MPAPRSARWSSRGCRRPCTATWSTVSSTTWCSTRSTSSAPADASRWPPGRRGRSCCSPSATPASRSRSRPARGSSRKDPCSAGRGTSTTSASGSISAGWSRWPTTDRSPCATRPVGRLRSWPGCPSRPAGSSSTSRRRSAAPETPEERDHLRQPLAALGWLALEPLAQIVVQGEVPLAPAEGRDGVRQLAPDVLRQHLEVAEDLDPFPRDAVLGLPAFTVHAFGPPPPFECPHARKRAHPSRRAEEGAGGWKNRAADPRRDPPPRLLGDVGGRLRSSPSSCRSSGTCNRCHCAP